MRSYAITLIAALIFSTSAQICFAQAKPEIRHEIKGVVVDQAGNAIAGAKVSFKDEGEKILQTTADSQGRFSIEIRAEIEGTIFVIVDGFIPSERRLTPKDSGDLLKVILQPAGPSERIVISAARTETRIAETPASITVLSSEDIQTSAAQTVDDLLRQVPGFQLFRRNGSRTANPTAQGVSLRGVGASGASRALVLLDGGPLNDPFGGWVYWGRIPRESIESIEVLRGGESSLYGSGALGGVVQIRTRRPDSPVFSISSSYGNQNTGEASVFTGGRYKKWGLSLASEWFRTDGYVSVEKASRGIVDAASNSRRLGTSLTIDRKIGDKGVAFLRGSVFGEARNNGTPLQTNRTHLRELSTGFELFSEDYGSFSAGFYGGSQLYDQIFSAVSANRNSESLTRIQRVPSRFWGFSGKWSRSLGKANTIVTGIDAKYIQGTSDETVFIQGIASSLVSAGGRESTISLYGADIFRISQKLQVVAKLRYDRWRNFEGRSETMSLLNPGQPALSVFPDRTEDALSPRISLLVQPIEKLSFYASGYKAFRTPTLNEMYRSFRVGNVLTLANENLFAERLTGAEAGTNIRLRKPSIEFRGVLFWSEITDPIANVTLSVTPSLITRQRQNLGRTRTKGIEAELHYRPTRDVTVTAGYLLSDSRVIEFPGNPLLNGRYLPQIPRHQFTFQVRYSNPSVVDIGIQGRASSRQFDDDQNLLALNSYFVIDTIINRQINRRFKLFFAVENLTNTRYEVGRTPVLTLGPPITVRGGVRLNFGAN